MDQLLKFLSESFPPMAYGVGLFVLLLIWMFQKPLIRLAMRKIDEGEGPPEPHPQRRYEDQIWARFIEAVERSAKAQEATAESLRLNGERLEGLNDRLRDLTSNLEQLAREMREGLKDVHRRIDDAIKRQN
jgi:hypothetical protein